MHLNYILGFMFSKIHKMNGFLLWILRAKLSLPLICNLAIFLSITVAIATSTPFSWHQKMKKVGKCSCIWSYEDDWRALHMIGYITKVNFASLLSAATHSIPSPVKFWHQEIVHFSFFFHFIIPSDMKDMLREIQENVKKKCQKQIKLSQPFYRTLSG